MADTVEELIRSSLSLESGVNIGDETGPGDIEAWDSLGHVNIIAGIEEAFQIHFEPDEIIGIRSVGDIKRILQQKKKQNHRSKTQ